MAADAGVDTHWPTAPLDAVNRAPAPGAVQ